jgi:putative NADH-flavin reductase
MHHILIVGASGGIGLEAVKLGLERGHAIRAMARSADRIAIEHPALERYAGDATDPGAVQAALRGVTAVIQAVGVAPSLERTFKPVHLFSETTRVLVPEMERAGVRRLVAVTGFGAGDSRRSLSLLERLPHRLLLGQAYDDKDRQEAIIRESDLDWLIVRPTILTNGARRGRYKVLGDPAQWRNGLISRADVADFLIREATDPQHSHATPVLAN